MLQCDAVMRQSIYNYTFNQKQPFIRIVVALPSMVSTARRILESRRISNASFGHRPRYSN